MKKLLVFAVAAVSMVSVATTASAFSTNKCKACHAVKKDKVGPAWEKVVKAYGDEPTLAGDFASGFKSRRVANSESKWKGKEGLMTAQFNHLIKGHEKEAAHALFETVKNNKFGNY